MEKKVWKNIKLLVHKLRLVKVILVDNQKGDVNKISTYDFFLERERLNLNLY